MRVTAQLLMIVVSLLSIESITQAQVRYEIHFPDLPGYQTLKCDFHMHTVFSDGLVWPTVRVEEAWQLGLDAVTLTDHIEYRPHKDDIPTNHNRPYDIAAGRAKEKNLLFPRAAEITRDTPPGHFNALFLNDVKPLDTPEFIDAIQAANEQDAFVFWNHQEWKGAEAGKWQEVHTVMYDKKWLHGMEVANGRTYYPTAHQWCLEKGLTMIGTSDIHGADQNERTTAERHRAMTLVFAKERTLESLKEALVEGRTAVWFEERLIGRRDLLEPLFEKCVQVAPPHLQTGNTTCVAVKNESSMDIQLQRTSGAGPAELTLPARSTFLLRIRAKRTAEPLELGYTATNFWLEPEKGLPVVLRIAGK